VVLEHQLDLEPLENLHYLELLEHLEILIDLLLVLPKQQMN
jgi:hypothetical protein